MPRQKRPAVQLKRMRKRGHAVRLKGRKGLLSALPDREGGSGMRKVTAKQCKAVLPASGETKQQYDADYNSGYNQGYDTGYRKGITDMQEPTRQFAEGHKQGYDEGYGKGLHAGGNGIVDSLLPEYEILPDIPIEQIIAAGVEHFRPQIIHLISAQELGERIVNALAARTPLSLVRLGDCELLTLAQDSVMPVEQVQAEGKILEYSGVHVPDLKTRDLLAQSVTRASIVGIPKHRVHNFLPLAYQVLRAHHIDYRALTLTDSLVNYYLYHAGYLSRITAGQRVLLIGNNAPQLAEVLQEAGVDVAGVIAPVKGVKDVSRVLEAVNGYDFDLALVSAGVSAVIIAEHIATRKGKVALDIGHLADSLASGEARFR